MKLMVVPCFDQTMQRVSRTSPHQGALVLSVFFGPTRNGNKINKIIQSIFRKKYIFNVRKLKY